MSGRSHGEEPMKVLMPEVLFMRGLFYFTAESQMP